MKLGYACAWWRPVGTTWSGSSAGLLGALEARPDVEVARIAAQRNIATASALVATARLRSYGVWKHQPANKLLTDRRVRRAISRNPVDAVVAVADVEPILDVPTFLYQDANFSAVYAHREVLAEHAPALFSYPSGTLEKLISTQRAAYSAAETVFAFSEWFADWLVEHDGVPREKISVIGGGVSVSPAARRARGNGGRRVLFVGREFHRKGGPLVVAAVERLRASGSGDFRLTVVGPAVWPMPTAVPEWVDFRGEVPAAVVAGLWAEHDIFAMPSWYEPYGLVFLEARAAGLPCLARNAFCMPALVPDGTGRLIPPSGGADDVADALAAIDADPQLFAAAAAGAAAVRAENTWERVADRAMARIGSVVGTG